MPAKSLIKIINIALRAITLVSKFILLFFLAKFLQPGDVGLYGLLAATVGYVLYAVGFEFYNFSNRDMIGANPRSLVGMVRDQAVLYGIIYIIILPLTLIIFINGWLPWSYVGWFLVLLVLEHVAQEYNRILVAISEPLLASCVLFLRSGAWCLVVVPIMWVFPYMRNLEFVLAAWIMGALAACIVSSIKLFSFDRSSIRNSVDWAWIKKGVKVAIPLLLASLAVRGMFTFDRYWVESISNMGVLGAYVLFMAMATAILSFLDAGVIVFLYPQLVAAAKAHDKVLFQQRMKNLTLNILIITGVLIVACWFLASLILPWLGKAVYLENIHILYWLLAAISIYALSTVPHMGLYAFGHDMPILYSQLAGFIVFLIAAYIGGKLFGPIAVPWALCLAFGMILFWKYFAYSKMKRGNTIVGWY